MSEVMFTSNEVASIVVAARSDALAFQEVMVALDKLRKEKDWNSLNSYCAQYKVSPMCETVVFDFFSAKVADKNGSLQKMIDACATLCCTRTNEGKDSKGAATNWRLLRNLQQSLNAHTEVRDELNALLKIEPYKDLESTKLTVEETRKLESSTESWRTSYNYYWMINMLPSAEAINRAMDAISNALMLIGFDKYSGTYRLNFCRDDATSLIRKWVVASIDARKTEEVICDTIRSVFPKFEPYWLRTVK